jgi:hypothetical protein
LLDDKPEPGLRGSGSGKLVFALTLAPRIHRLQLGVEIILSVVVPIGKLLA